MLTAYKREKATGFANTRAVIEGQQPGFNALSRQVESLQGIGVAEGQLPRSVEGIRRSLQPAVGELNLGSTRSANLHSFVPEPAGLATRFQPSSLNPSIASAESGAAQVTGAPARSVEVIGKPGSVVSTEAPAKQMAGENVSPSRALVIAEPGAVVTADKTATAGAARLGKVAEAPASKLEPVARPEAPPVEETVAGDEAAESPRPLNRKARRALEAAQRKGAGRPEQSLADKLEASMS